jgi:hypothetical protein
MLVAMLALFIAVGGGNAMAGAAASAKKLISGSQIKKGSIGADRLTASARKKLRGNTGPAGPTGPSGSVTGATAGGDLTGTYPNPSIADRAITTGKIAPNAITSDLVGLDVLQDVDLAANSVGNSELKAGSVQGSVFAVGNKDVIADGTIGQLDIATNGVGPSDLAVNSVGGDYAGEGQESELREDSVGGRELRFGAVGQDEIFDGGVRSEEVSNGSLTGVDVQDRSLTADDISVNAGHVTDNGADLTPNTCSTNTVDAGTANISNDVIAVTLDSASFGSTPTSVRHATSTDSFLVVICNGNGIDMPRPDFDWIVFNRP